MSNIKIELVPYKIDYFQGESVSGQVIYTRETGTFSSVLFVTLAFIGYEYVVVNPDDYPLKTETRVLYEKKVVLAGKPNSGNGLPIQSSATWPFAFVMPTSVPGSFRHPSGWAKISYQFRAEIGLSNSVPKVADYEICLRSVPDAPPVSLLAARNEAKFLFSKQPLTMECTLDTPMGYVGDPIFITTSINNLSSKKVSSLQISLIQHCRIRKVDRDQVIKVYSFSDHFPVDSGKTFNGKISVSIPVGAEPSLMNAKLFSLSYTLRVCCMIGSDAECPVDLPLVVYMKPQSQTQNQQGNVIVQNIVINQYSSPPQSPQLPPTPLALPYDPSQMQPYPMQYQPQYFQSPNMNYGPPSYVSSTKPPSYTSNPATTKPPSYTPNQGVSTMNSTVINSSSTPGTLYTPMPNPYGQSNGYILAPKTEYLTSPNQSNNSVPKTEYSPSMQGYIMPPFPQAPPTVSASYLQPPPTSQLQNLSYSTASAPPPSPFSSARNTERDKTK